MSAQILSSNSLSVADNGVPIFTHNNTETPDWLYSEFMKYVSENEGLNVLDSDQDIQNMYLQFVEQCEPCEPCVVDNNNNIICAEDEWKQVTKNFKNYINDNELHIDVDPPNHEQCVILWSEYMNACWDEKMHENIIKLGDKCNWVGVYP